MDRRNTDSPKHSTVRLSDFCAEANFGEKKKGRKEEKERVRVSVQAVISMDLKLRGEVITSGCHLFASNILLLAYSL